MNRKYILEGRALNELIQYYLTNSCEESLVEMFEDSRYWQDVELILPIHILFEKIDRLKLGRDEGQLTCEKYCNILEDITQNYSCEIDSYNLEKYSKIFDENYFMTRVEFNLSTLLVKICNDFHQGTIIIS